MDLLPPILVRCLRSGARRRGIALCLLLAQAAPGAAVLGGVSGYLILHRLEHAFQETLARELPDLVRWSGEGITHSHGPGEEPHSHGAVVTVTLDLTREGGRHDPSPTLPLSGRVAPHLPATADFPRVPVAPPPLRGASPGNARIPLAPPRTPLLPPPRG